MLGRAEIGRLRTMRFPSWQATSASLDRTLDNRYVRWAGGLIFLGGLVRAALSAVENDPLTVLTVVLIGVGVILLALPLFEHLRRKERSPQEVQPPTRPLTYNDLKEMRVPIEPAQSSSPVGLQAAGERTIVATGYVSGLKPPTIAFKLDESSDLSMKLREGFPQSRLIEVGIRNPNGADLNGVHTNILMTEGIRAGDEARCDAFGRHTPGGWWGRTTPEAIGDEQEGDSYKDYWGADKDGLTLTASSMVLPFKLTIRKPGTYRFRAKFWGGDMPREVEKDAFLLVEGADELRPERDAISEVIFWGEQMLAHKPSDFEGNSPPTEWAAWIVSAAEVIPDSHRDHYDAVTTDGPQTGPAYWKARTWDLIRALYEIRARLA
jgi:hypothetical protein